jgi:hypothetical protein
VINRRDRKGDGQTGRQTEKQYTDARADGQTDGKTRARTRQLLLSKSRQDSEGAYLEEGFQLADIVRLQEALLPQAAQELHQLRTQPLVCTHPVDDPRARLRFERARDPARPGRHSKEARHQRGRFERQHRRRTPETGCVCIVGFDGEEGSDELLQEESVPGAVGREPAHFGAQSFRLAENGKATESVAPQEDVVRRQQVVAEENQYPQLGPRDADSGSGSSWRKLRRPLLAFQTFEWGCEMRDELKETRGRDGPCCTRTRLQDLEQLPAAHSGFRSFLRARRKRIQSGWPGRDWTDKRPCAQGSVQPQAVEGQGGQQHPVSRVAQRARGLLRARRVSDDVLAEVCQVRVGKKGGRGLSKRGRSQEAVKDDAVQEI